MSRSATAKLQEAQDDFGPDLLCDPSFVPCRDESCPREGLHPAHEVAVGNRASRKLDLCPRCQSPVVVTQVKQAQVNGKKRRHLITANCVECGWTFVNTLKKRIEDETHQAR